MSRHEGWEPCKWKGAAGLKEERDRAQHRCKIAGLVVAVFAYGLLQVWLCTDVAERQSLLTELRAEVSHLEVDLKVEKARLDQRRDYGELVAAAEATGFGAAGVRRVLVVDGPIGSGSEDLWHQMAEGIRAGRGVIWTEAMAGQGGNGDRRHAVRP